MVTINTGNKHKQAEFKKFFGEDTVFLNLDVKEPRATALEIIRYKASQFDNVIVDDTSLYVDGHDFGPMIKWNIKSLIDCVGRNAIFSCLLAKHTQQKIFIYKGEVQGTICKKQGEDFGFNPYFIPKTSTHSLAEQKPNHHNARFLASQKALQENWDNTYEPLLEWHGEFQ